jgi:hypothetical protein
VADGLRLDNVEAPPVRIAETTDSLVREIVALLKDSTAQQQLGATGRAFVERHFNWPSSVEALDDVCRRASRSQALVARHADTQRERTTTSPAKENLGAIDTVA